jgi:uncharacterized membrane protein
MFVAGIVVAGSAFEAARRRERPAEVALLLGLTRIGVLLVAVGGLMLPIFGLWMVHLGSWGYGSGWIDWALGLYVVALLLGALVASDPSRRADSRAAWRLMASRSTTSCRGCSTTESHALRTTPRCCSCSRSWR